MGRSTRSDAHTRLTDWADAERPVPSADLQRFMGPARPVPARAVAPRSVPAVARLGLGLKVLLAAGALAMTSAAAVGITHVVSARPPAHGPVVAPGASSATGSPDPAGSRSPATASPRTPEAAASPGSTPRRPAPTATGVRSVVRSSTTGDGPGTGVDASSDPASSSDPGSSPDPVSPSDPGATTAPAPDPASTSDATATGSTAPSDS